MENKSETVCFSGHRILHDPQETVTQQLENAIRNCIEDGKTTFMTGGAIGFDTLAAETVIELRKIYPDIRLVIALPCPPEQQTIKWTANQKEKYNEILNLADEVKILTPDYTDGCMLSRNKYMVDNSSTLICYLRSPRGGTKYTGNYAKKSGLVLLEI